MDEGQWKIADNGDSLNPCGEYESLLTLSNSMKAPGKNYRLWLLSWAIELD